MDKDKALDSWNVVWPLGKSRTKQIPLSARPTDPSKSTVGLLWDYVLKGDEVFEVLKSELSASYPDMKFIDYAAFGDLHGHDELDVLAALPDRLRANRVDTVIVAMAA